MEVGKDGFIGKRIFLVYDDGNNHFSNKTGICTGNNLSEIVINNNILIPKTRIIRVEVRE